MQIKSIKSHKEIWQRLTKSMKIPLGNPIRKICTKHEVTQGLSKKRRQSSFTGNARKEGKRTLIKNLVATKSRKTKTSCTTNYSPPFSPPPFSRTHPLMHAFASPPRHQLQPPTILLQPCFGQGPKGMKSHKEISQRPKSRKYQKEIS